MHIIAGMHNSFNEQLTPRLQLVIHSIKKSQALTTPQRVRLPITLEKMWSIKQILSVQPVISCSGQHVAWLSFFGSSVLVNSLSHVTPTMTHHFTCLSRTSLLITEIDYLGATEDTLLCPVLGMLPYLARRGACAGPLFLTEDGQGLTRQYFCTAINSINPH